MAAENPRKNEQKPKKGATSYIATKIVYLFHIFAYFFVSEATKCFGESLWGTSRQPRWPKSFIFLLFSNVQLHQTLFSTVLGGPPCRPGPPNQRIHSGFLMFWGPAAPPNTAGDSIWASRTWSSDTKMLQDSSKSAIFAPPRTLKAAKYRDQRCFALWQPKTLAKISKNQKKGPQAT